MHHSKFPLLRLFVNFREKKFCLRTLTFLFHIFLNIYRIWNLIYFTKQNVEKVVFWLFLRHSRWVILSFKWVGVGEDINNHFVNFIQLSIPTIILLCIFKSSPGKFKKIAFRDPDKYYCIAKINLLVYKKN